MTRCTILKHTVQGTLGGGGVPKLDPKCSLALAFPQVLMSENYRMCTEEEDCL